jgi:hypothetical protein
MEIQPDFKELLALFNAHQVEYIIVGAHALAHHSAPRYTGDVDLLVRPDAENADRILRALEEFGFGNLQLRTRSYNWVLRLSGYRHLIDRTLLGRSSI